MSRRSGNPWAYELVSGAIGSDLHGRCRLRRYRARRPKDRARDAGGALGMCGAMPRGRERGRESEARARGGQRAVHACGIGLPCGRGRCARTRAGEGREVHTSDSISASLPRRETTKRKKVVGPRVRGQGYGPHPADRCT